MLGLESTSRCIVGTPALPTEAHGCTSSVPPIGRIIFFRLQPLIAPSILHAEQHTQAFVGTIVLVGTAGLLFSRAVAFHEQALWCPKLWNLLMSLLHYDTTVVVLLYSTALEIC